MLDKEKLLPPLERIRLKRIEQRMAKEEHKGEQKERGVNEEIASFKDKPKRKRGRKLLVKKEKQNDKDKKDEEDGDESEDEDEES